LIPGSCVEVLAFSEWDRNLELQVQGRNETVVVGPAVSAQILVERTE
jgi:hypothetical protein